MNKQQIDRDHSQGSGARLKRFARIDKDREPSRSSKILQRRSEPSQSDAHMAAFLKIDRHNTA